MIGGRPERQKTERNLEIMDKWRAGTSQKALAAEYGISPARINAIISMRLRVEDAERRREQAAGWIADRGERSGCTGNR